MPAGMYRTGKYTVIKTSTFRTSLNTGQFRAIPAGTGRTGRRTKTLEQYQQSCFTPQDNSIEREAQLAKTAQKCTQKLSGKEFVEGTDNGSRHSYESVNAKSPLSPIARKCGRCGSTTCQCSISCNSTHASSSVPPKYIRVAQETHQDGNLHLHCLIQFEGKYQCTNNRFFNLLSTSRSGHFHPNIQGARSSTDVNTYISKHGDFIEWGNFQIDGRSARGCTTAIGDAYAEALNSTNKEAALRVIKEKDPKNYVLQFHNINANLDRIFVPVEEPFQSKWDPLSFNVPNDMKQWAEDNVLIDAAARPTRPISLILEGESRLGKTACIKIIN
ncbi:hypothetical protein SO802_025255 [Lithocarpus litseifolius]|uniref:CRESS-DNA virus Rep endonuclease domain-containing protein n=1 Tax=Lithocarpus litseifolius TaxID=425828 RepID=A0AAW2C1Q5_9ROSI